MKLKVGSIVAIAIGVAAAIGVLGSDFEEKKTDNVFHVTLADPAMYENGVFIDSFEIEKGRYQFGFVPNGDSPQKLTISLSGPNHNSVEEFELSSESHETGISQYFTWRYIGNNESAIEVVSSQQIQITINPNENYNGPVSVFLKKLP